MGESPYKVFGTRLRKIREQAKESLLEVSGAVEIDVKTLERIESGTELPDEDILLLLINHFDVAEDDAVKLWELAGYTKGGNNSQNVVDEQAIKQIMMVIPFDNRVVFTDVAHIEANKKGVIIDFAHQLGNVQPQTVARVGMSLEQAKELYMQLGSNLYKAMQPKIRKQLPAPQKHPRKTEKKKSS